MTAVELWDLLVSKYPAECARLRNSIFPLPDTDKALYEKIDRLAINTSIADGGQVMREIHMNNRRKTYR